MTASAIKPPRVTEDTIHSFYLSTALQRAALTVLTRTSYRYEQAPKHVRWLAI